MNSAILVYGSPMSARKILRAVNVGTLVASLALCSCGKHAEIHIKDRATLGSGVLGENESSVIAEIKQNDTVAIYAIRQDNGQRLKIMKSAILDIDHPGTELLLVSAIISFVGASLVAWGASEYKHEKDRELASDAGRRSWYILPPGVLITTVGISLAIPGLTIWGRSKTAAGSMPNSK